MRYPSLIAVRIRIKKSFLLKWSLWKTIRVAHKKVQRCWNGMDTYQVSITNILQWVWNYFSFIFCLYKRLREEEEINIISIRYKLKWSKTKNPDRLRNGWSSGPGIDQVRFVSWAQAHLYSYYVIFTLWHIYSIYT